MGVRKIGYISTKLDHNAVMRSIEMELWKIAGELENIALDYISRKNISVDGDIADSVKGLVKRVVKGLRIEFGANVRHAIFVHEGTKPHWVPSEPHDPLRTWVKKKLNPPHSEVASITWFVRKKIAEEGTKAKPFLAVAVRAMRNKIEPRIQKAIARAS
jgi:hypothetical protein